MDTKLWPQLALTALVAGVLVAGLLTVGGPEAGRIEKRDDQRYWDLIALQSQAQCLAREAGETPATLDNTESCSLNVSEEALLPEEGYRYLPQDDGSFKVCAEFEDIDGLRTRQWRGDISENGCLSGKTD
ncbi:hypothetical protein [Celeribacter sp. PS-C1]|uniref:hypothetical protein n=1 Tax=Celeribacter sp. PS-C1 TaxID=2820813 RepID=UPI001CA58DAF|nr:hypothetical protein [Celeribacter sp. PS-C1]MBW6417937.1 hypothetical protein [Celeribacter sp. PS-C1]